MTLEMYVKEYIKNNKNNEKSLNNYLEKYSSLNNIEDAIKYGATARLSNENKHSHQRRLKVEILEQVRDKLLEEVEKIKKCTSFEELIEIVEECKESGFGELAIYDTALRIGSNINIYPEKVYLHAGTKKGAKELGLKISNKVIEFSDLPEELKGLKPYEVEDFLCIYKDKFRNIIERKYIKEKLVKVPNFKIIRYNYLKE